MENAIFGLIGSVIGAIFSYYATRYKVNKNYQSEILRIEKDNNESIRHYEIKVKELEFENDRIKQSYEHEKEIMKQRHDLELHKSESSMKNNLAFSLIQDYLDNEDGEKKLSKLFELEKAAKLQMSGKLQGHKSKK